MFFNLSSDDWKPSCRLDMHSGCGKVHEESPPLIGQNIWFYVVGMTIWVGQGQSHLSADVPGITMTSSQEAGFDQRAGCASSRLASSPLEARASEDDENPQPMLY
jgi:hypothetical protein